MTINVLYHLYQDLLQFCVFSYKLSLQQTDYAKYLMFSEKVFYQTILDCKLSVLKIQRII